MTMTPFGSPLCVCLSLSKDFPLAGSQLILVHRAMFYFCLAPIRSPDARPSQASRGSSSSPLVTISSHGAAARRTEEAAPNASDQLVCEALTQFWSLTKVNAQLVKGSSLSFSITENNGSGTSCCKTASRLTWHTSEASSWASAAFRLPGSPPNQGNGHTAERCFLKSTGRPLGPIIQPYRELQMKHAIPVPFL